MNHPGRPQHYPLVGQVGPEVRSSCRELPTHACRPCPCMQCIHAERRKFGLEVSPMQGCRQLPVLQRISLKGFHDTESPASNSCRSAVCKHPCRDAPNFYQIPKQAVKCSASRLHRIHVAQPSVSLHTDMHQIPTKFPAMHPCIPVDSSLNQNPQVSQKDQLPRITNCAPSMQDDTGPCATAMLGCCGRPA